MLGDKLHTQTTLIQDAGRQTEHKNSVNTRCWETNCTHKQRKYTMPGDKLHTKTALIHDAGRQAAHKNNVNTRCWETNCTQKQR